MGSPTMSDFNLDSEGHCFFCLKQTPVKVKKEPQLLATPRQLQNSSVHYFARYLGMDIGKVLIEDGQRDSDLLAKVRQSRLKVELCEKCTSLNKTFSRLCRQLEKLEMEIKSSLGLIQDEFLGANRRNLDTNLLKFSSTSSVRNEWSQIVDVLRQETIQKSSRKLRAVSPRVEIEKLTKMQIDAGLSKHQINSGIPKIEPEESSFENNNMEFEENVKSQFGPLNENVSSDDDNRNHELDSEAMDYDIEQAKLTDYPRAVVDQNLGSGNVFRKNSPDTSSTTSDVGKGKHSFNPKTRRWKCSACSMELTSKPGIDFHYQSVHQNIRYRCVPCGKEFVHKHTYNRHHQSVHVGVRLKCLICNKLFSRKDKLLAHQRRKTCGERTS